MSGDCKCGLKTNTAPTDFVVRNSLARFSLKQKMAEEDHPVLNREKIMQILESVEGTQHFDITSCRVRPGTEPGENFASEMLVSKEI